MSYNPGDQVDDRGHQVVRVAAADGNIQSVIPNGAKHVIVSAITTDANDWVLLPTGVPGQEINGWSVVAHELRTQASSGELINGVDADGTQEAAIPATTKWRAYYVNSTYGWILEAQTELGVDIAGIVPD